jgi:hypothetical protein
MNYLIEFLCGIVTVFIVVGPPAYYGLWNLTKFCYVLLVEFVTSGDKKPQFNYSDFEEDFGEFSLFGFIWIVLGIFAVGVLFVAGFSPNHTPAELIMVPYNVGVIISPVLSLFMLVFVVVMSMKYGYKLNKFTKQLKSHVEDKGAHK